MRRILFLALALAACGLDEAPLQDGISERSVRAIERQAVMPYRAAALADYDRYYSVRERDVVMGVFLLRSSFRFRPDGASPFPNIPGAYAIAQGDVPLVSDGGCGVVTLYFDVARMRLMPIQPNGEPGEEGELAVCNGIA